ncbi:tRNA-dihydrouridine synthase family protein [Candidatus Saccharibacteria bacterium]|nr:tRNA-dihydrouridine synthase family protein [Candidatus Saccharibacteria bacterium]
MNIWQELPKPFLVLAPMEGVTDIIFRQVIAHAGRPDLFFTEFTNVSSYASEKGRANALERLQITPTDKPIIAQIWGKDPAHFAETAEALESLGFSGVDLNFGCPDKHVNKAGGGAAMIQNPNLATECYQNARKSTNLPVSIKTRLGWNKPEEYQEWLSTLLNQHPAALTVHLRTKKEMSKVPAHYELIPEIVKLRTKLSPETILVVNGDIKDKTHALELHRQYPEVDGFMIGRGVFANPYCFTSHAPTREELMELLKLHLNLYEKSAFFANIEERKGKIFDFAAEGAERDDIIEDYHLAKLPKYCEKCRHIPYESLKHFFKIYINNFPGAKDLRAKLMETHSLPEARAIIES